MIEFKLGNIEKLHQYSDFGYFDYIDCGGVLMHCVNPNFPYIN
eukprot:UN12882